MDLNFTEEQAMLRAAVRDLCDSHVTSDIIRELEDDQIGYPLKLWEAMAQMDLLGVGLPVEYGGAGMGSVEAALVYEELGRALAPSPHLPSVVLAGGLLANAGTEEQQAAWLPGIAAGEIIGTIAWYEPQMGDGPEGIQLAADSQGGRVQLNGTKILVPFAESADVFVTLARGPDGVETYLVDADASGLHLEQTETLASDASFRVRFEDVKVPAQARIGPPGGGWESFAEVMDDALIAQAAYAVGGADRVHKMAVAYARERVQFGVPIGNFQGLAHPLADMATEIEGARALTYEAAWVRDEIDGSGDPDEHSGPLPAMAKHAATRTFRRTGRVAHQVFGGIGFTRAIDVQLYFRRAKQLELQWFEPRTLLERVASRELDGDAPFVGIDPGWRKSPPHPVA